MIFDVPLLATEPPSELLGKLRYSYRPLVYEGDHYVFDGTNWKLVYGRNVKNDDWWNVIPKRRYDLYWKLNQLEGSNNTNWVNIESFGILKVAIVTM